MKTETKKMTLADEMEEIAAFLADHDDVPAYAEIVRRAAAALEGDPRGWAVGLSSQLDACIFALDSIALDHGAPDRLIRIARRAAADARMKVEQARAALRFGGAQ